MRTTKAEWVAWLAVLAAKDRGRYRDLRSIAWDLVAKGDYSEHPSKMS
jgi:hypothetical protein